MKIVELITLSNGDKFKYEEKDYEVERQSQIEVLCYNITDYKSEKLPRYLKVKVK